MLPSASATKHVENFCVAKRIMFPVGAAALATFSHPCKGEEGMAPEAWLHTGRRSKWIGVTGEAPADGTPTMVMMKEKFMAGLLQLDNKCWRIP